jgi:hypothetical protein
MGRPIPSTRYGAAMCLSPASPEDPLNECFEQVTPSATHTQDVVIIPGTHGPWYSPAPTNPLPLICARQPQSPLHRLQLQGTSLHTAVFTQLRHTRNVVAPFPLLFRPSAARVGDQPWSSHQISFNPPPCRLSWRHTLRRAAHGEDGFNMRSQPNSLSRSP